jgi:hypothetical protein
MMPTVNLRFRQIGHVRTDLPWLRKANASSFYSRFLCHRPLCRDCLQLASHKLNVGLRTPLGKAGAFGCPSVADFTMATERYIDTSIHRYITGKNNRMYAQCNTGTCYLWKTAK